MEVLEGTIIDGGRERLDHRFGCTCPSEQAASRIFTSQLLVDNCRVLARSPGEAKPQRGRSRDRTPTELGRRQLRHRCRSFQSSALDRSISLVVISAWSISVM